jgi:hypothetical protein
MMIREKVSCFQPEEWKGTHVNIHQEYTVLNRVWPYKTLFYQAILSNYFTTRGPPEPNQHDRRETPNSTPV